MESLAEEQTGLSAETHLEMLLRPKVKKDGRFLSFDARNDCILTHISRTMSQTRGGANNKE